MNAREDTNFILNATPNYAYGRRHGYSDEQTEAMANEVYMGMEIAFEKGMPMKPRRVEDNSHNPYLYLCVCGLAGDFNEYPYCPSCGQALRWEESDAE